jgi:hypothetical protein
VSSQVSAELEKEQREACKALLSKFKKSSSPGSCQTSIFPADPDWDEMIEVAYAELVLGSCQSQESLTSKWCQERKDQLQRFLEDKHAMKERQHKMLVQERLAQLRVAGAGGGSGRNSTLEGNPGGQIQVIRLRVSAVAPSQHQGNDMTHDIWQ